MSIFKGPWRRVTSKLKDMKDTIAGPAKEELQILGDNIAADVIANMKSNPPPVLAAMTIERKAQQGYPFPNLRWYQSGWMIDNAMEVSVKVGRLGRTSLITTVTDKVHPEANMRTSTLFKWLEYGTTKMPGRPVLTPVYRAIKRGKYKPMDKFTKSIQDRIRVEISSPF